MKNNTLLELFDIKYKTIDFGTNNPHINRAISYLTKIDIDIIKKDIDSIPIFDQSSHAEVIKTTEYLRRYGCKQKRVSEYLSLIEFMMLNRTGKYLIDIHFKDYIIGIVYEDGCMVDHKDDEFTSYQQNQLLIAPVFCIHAFNDSAIILPE